VLCHERPGAGGGFLLADQDGGAEPVPGRGQAAGVDAGQGAVGGQGGVGEAFHLPQRVAGLGRPAPLAGRGGISYGL